MVSDRVRPPAWVRPEPRAESTRRDPELFPEGSRKVGRVVESILGREVREGPVRSGEKASGMIESQHSDLSTDAPAVEAPERPRKVGWVNRPRKMRWSEARPGRVRDRQGRGGTVET